jgi:hypothetical protein
MHDPKVNAVLFCQKAVFTSPWWNLVGVCTELYLRENGEAEFDVFLRLGDATSEQDFRIEVCVVDPETKEELASFASLSRGTDEGIATAVFPLEVVFPRDDVYNVEVRAEGRLLDVQLLPVLLMY